MEQEAADRERKRAVSRRKWLIEARRPPLDWRVRLTVRQTGGAALAPEESVEVVSSARVGELQEANHQMHAALLQIADADALEEAQALARTGATWG